MKKTKQLQHIISSIITKNNNFIENEKIINNIDNNVYLSVGSFSMQGIHNLDSYLKNNKLLELTTQVFFLNQKIQKINSNIELGLFKCVQYSSDKNFKLNYNVTITILNQSKIVSLLITDIKHTKNNLNDKTSIVCKNTFTFKNQKLYNYLNLESNLLDFFKTILAHELDCFTLVDTINETYYLFTKNNSKQEITLSNVFYNYNDFYTFQTKYIIEYDKHSWFNDLKPDIIIQKLIENNAYENLYQMVDSKGTILKKRICALCLNPKTKIMCITQSDVTKLYNKLEYNNIEIIKALKVAENANKAKSDFLSAMSHDIRTPINAIVGMINVATYNLDDKEQLKECFNVIKESSDLLITLIKDILDMNKLESGEVEILNEKFYCSIEFPKFLEMAAPMFNEKKQTLKIKKDIKHDIYIGDTYKFKRVLLNLLANASKYTPKNGNILFSMTEIKTDNPKIVTLKCVIKDNGIGISKQELKSIFDPFYRSSKEFVQNTEGTGLGLSISKSMIEALGGTISVKSELNKGSEFTVNYPIQIDPLENIINTLNLTNKKDKITKVSEKNLTSLKKKFNNKKILIVDDNKINLIVAEKIFDNLGLNVICVKNGVEALNVFLNDLNSTIDIILMDIKMPLMDGLEATQKIRSNSKQNGKNIPIIAFSANAFVEDISKALQAGMNDYLVKPIEIEKVIDILDKYIL